ncbi:MAG TPA: hypothetical protein DCL49_01285 [Candidatus Omnitrophica bacterium]|nr:hypothetical protein [Candidatus Omnitrophota bacterium]
MQTYSYTASDSVGKILHGVIPAENDLDLANKVSGLGHYLIRAKVVANPVKVNYRLRRIKPKGVLSFTIHLHALLDSGAHLSSALGDLARDSETEDTRKLIEDIRLRVEGGTSLRESLSYHPKSFPKIYTAVVGAGESTGKLLSALKDLIGLLEWQMELRSKMIEAAVYPLTLIFAMVGVVILLVVKVIPIFEPLFAQGGISLPWPTRVVLGISSFIRNFWYLCLAAPVLLAGGYKFYYSTSGGKYVLDDLKLKLPVLGGLLRKVALSRFCRTFAISLKSGLTVLSALDIAEEVVGNIRLERSVAKARDSVNIGEKISTSLQATGDFPPLIVRMISVGEQSGSLPEALDKVNLFYDREVPATIKTMFTFFEPVMIVVIGVVVGGIAISVLLPMFQLAQVVGD